MNMKAVLSKLKLDTLFFRLLANFFIIIALFVLFYVLSLSFNKKNIHDEIILYNQLNMDNTVDNYERQLEAIKKSAMNLYWNEKVRLLYSKTIQGNPFDYYEANVVAKQLKSNMLESPYQYVDQVYLVFQQVPAIIGRDGVYAQAQEFNRFIGSSPYGEQLWSSSAGFNSSFRLFPSAAFSGAAIQATGSETKQLIPLLLRNEVFPNMNIVVLLDAVRLRQDLHQSVNQSLLILDEREQPIYEAGMAGQTAIPADSGKNYAVHNDNYYFTGQGDSGLTYVHIIPTEHIAAKLDRQTGIFLALLLVAIALSILVSIAFSRQLNSPIKSLMDSLKQMKTPGELRGSIKEFNVIRDNLKDLQHRHSALRYYAYSNKIKNIHSNFGRAQELMDTGRRFALLVTEVSFRKHGLDLLNLNTDQAVNVIREYINVHLTNAYPGSLTFQQEYQQMVSIVFLDEESPDLAAELKRLKTVLDRDRHAYYLTIAFTEPWSHTNELSEAYELTMSMLSRRHLHDDTQIIHNREPQKNRYVLTANHEMEFHNYLMAGNEREMRDWVDRQLNAFKRRGNYAIDYRVFGNQVKAKVDQTMHGMQLDVNKLLPLAEQLHDCHTPADYREFYDHYLHTVAEMINEQKDKRDPITTFVIEYLNNHYKEDVSLDMLAEPLKITGGYLSTYFKEKTGWNYSDYLNNLRMEKAKHILQHTDLKIKTVAEQVGYPNVNSFIRMFKKVTGLTPGDFRKSNQTEDGIQFIE